MAQSTPTVPPQSAKATPNDAPPGCVPIPGMRPGWFFHEKRRVILHRLKADAEPITVGPVPKVPARIAHTTDEGEYIRIEYQILGPRQRRPRIVTEDELDRGTWAAKAGMARPRGADARQAFATAISMEAEKAPELSARTFYNDGDLIIPDAEAQPYGYRRRTGSEEAARKAWEEIGAWSTLEDAKAALVLGGTFIGPALDSLGVLAHIFSVYGPGQQGKSTVLTAAAATLGNIKPRSQQVMMTWNSSKQGIMQTLRTRGFLPMVLDEHSSSGRSVKDASKEFSQIVAGCIRAMGGADGSPRESDGFWHSVLLSSSNDRLRLTGQTEDLASRLHEISAPFYPNVWVDAEGDPADKNGEEAEHVSKRIKRLAQDHGGWPLEWAVQQGAFQAANLAELKRLHMKLCAKHSPREGGIPDTIAEIAMTWVVGAHLLGHVVGVPELGPAAERAAVAELPTFQRDSAEANVPDGWRLWEALDALRLESSAFPEAHELPDIAADGMRRLKGFTQKAQGLWWVLDTEVKRAAAEYEIENADAALRQLDDLGIHLREEKADGRAQRQLPKPIRKNVKAWNLPNRMHCFHVGRAWELYAPEEEQDGDGKGANEPEPPPEPPGVVPDFKPVTWGGTTGTTGTTSLEIASSSVLGEGSAEAVSAEAIPDRVSASISAGDNGSASAIEVPPVPSAPPTVGVPELQEHEQPVYPRAVRVAQPDVRWDLIAASNERWTQNAASLGVLAADALYLPNCEPVTVPLPGSVDEVPALMEAYELRTLYLHISAVRAMGLPEFDPRDPAWEGGPQHGPVHPWMVRAEGSQITKMIPDERLACWLTLLLGKRKLMVAIPAYDDRIDRTDVQGNARRGGFGGAPDGASMLDALMVYLLSTIHGHERKPKVTPFYLSINKTAEDYAAGIKHEDVWSDMIRRRQVPPVHVRMKYLVNIQWRREMTDAERGAAWLHQFDKSAAWLAAYSTAKLGVGDPVHVPDGGTFDSRVQGYYRVAEVPGQGPEGLPNFQFTPAEEGGFWLRGPAIELLKEVHPGWEPEVLEAWVWPTTKRALLPMYNRLYESRTAILSAIEEGRPGAKFAKQINGRLYQSFLGYLHQQSPQTDRETGEILTKRVFWRPDWAQNVIELATVNTWRNLWAYYKTDGRSPLSLSTDAAIYTADTDDPELARPASMKFAATGGGWQPEALAPVSGVLPIIAEGHDVRRAFKLYLDREG